MTNVIYQERKNYKRHLSKNYCLKTYSYRKQITERIFCILVFTFFV